MRRYIENVATACERLQRRSSMSPQNMIEQVLAGDGDYDLLWSLIGAVRNGFPVENLRPLLVSEAAERFPGSPFETILSMLVGKRTRLDTRSLRITDARLKQFIDHDEPVVRRFGVGLSARPTYVVDIGRLEIARGCRDEEGLRVIDFTMHRPRAALARLEYQKSGSQRGERWRTRQRSRDSQG